MSQTNKAKLIKDRGGTRSGIDRRQNPSIGHKIERRKFKDRRRGFDRRGDLGCRRGLNFESAIERRDVFRHRGKSELEVPQSRIRE
jgi:hypothetical protein